MSFTRGVKEFFGLAPTEDDVRDDAYYDEPRYGDDGAAAYAPRYEREPREPYTPEPQAPAPAPAPAPVARTAPKYTPMIVKVAPASYADATEIGEPFRDGDIVIFEITGADHAVAKRIIDFAAGLCFATRGQMRNLSKGVDNDRRVFALVPEEDNTPMNELRHAAGLR
jgi:cell division inhibitor SepF